MGDVTRVKLFDLAGKRIYVAGHRGMVGSAIVRRLTAYKCDVITAGREEADLERQEQGGVFKCGQTRRRRCCRGQGRRHSCHANDAYPAEFIRKNLAIALNTIHGSYKAGVKKLLFHGSSCIYQNSPASR
jgi:GDP-L-fucose synthase